MKNVKLLFLLLLSFILSCKKEECQVCEVCPPVTPPPPETCKIDFNKGLLAYYPFNGNADDASGKGNNGVFMNGAGLTTDHLGRTNKAAAFDGVNDYLIVNDNGKLNSDTMTISLMILSNNVDAVYGIISKQDFNSAKGFQFGIAQSFANDRKINFSVAPPTDPCDFLQLYDGSIAVNATQPLTNGRWFHIMVTFAGNQQRLYIDGTLMGTLTRSFTTMKKCTNSQLIMGAWWKDALDPFNGKLDEVRIFNRLLTDCEVAELNRIYN
jgi:hypothetical protein